MLSLRACQEFFFSEHIQVQIYLYNGDLLYLVICNTCIINGLDENW